MILTDEIKIIDDKIKANQAQYDIDIDAAKISALSSKELDKYEYLTSEDLENKPGEAERAKFGYSSLEEVLSDENKNKTDKIVKKGKQTNKTKSG